MFNDPFIISSIILSFSFILILIFNNKIKSKIIKYSFLILSIIFLILITFFDNKYIYDLLKLIITFIWYPNYLIFVLIIIISIINLIYTLIKKISLKRQIFNYLLFGICFSIYISYLRLDINTSLYSSIYSDNSLILLRIVSITFIIWIIITIIFKLIDRSNKKNEK